MSESSYDFFLSCSGEDRELADRVYGCLLKDGYSVCYQPESFPLGKSFIDQINRGLDASARVIALVTPNYFGNSQYTNAEFEAAYVQKKLLIFRFSRAEIPPLAQSLAWQEFREGLSADEFETMVRAAARERQTLVPQAASRISLLKGLPNWKGKGGSSHELIGRERELHQLADAFNDKRCSVLCVIAEGGLGKSSLVRAWIEEIAQQSYLGIQAGFSYSFYAQGWEGGQDISSFPFFKECLVELSGVPRELLEERGGADRWPEQIKSIVKSRPTLLVLDGLEPHQNQAGDAEEGRIKDAALRNFVEEMSMPTGGLCIITSRIMPVELLGPPMSSGRVRRLDVKRFELPQSIEAFIACGLSKTHPQLESWARKSDGHPLLITLLAPAIEAGNYSTEEFRADRVLTAKDVSDFPATIRNVVVSHLNWLGPEAQAIICSIALFDRAVRYRELKDEILARRPLPMVTDALWDVRFFGLLRGYSEKKFKNGLAKLKKAGMLNPFDEKENADSWVLEAHALVQGGVRAELIQKHHALWREANWTVYLSRTQSVKDKLPKDKADLIKLYEAVPHGVNAGRGKTAGWMYATRCLHGFRCYSTNQHGMIGDDVALMSHYFEGNWGEVKKDIGLNNYAKVQAYVWAGSILAGVNRSREGLPLMKLGLQLARENRNFATAARTGRNLGIMSALAGDLKGAEKYLNESIEDLEKPRPLVIRFIELKLVDFPFQRMSSHAALGSILHYQGKFAEAEKEFERATGHLQKASRFKTLRGLPCYHQVGFLLDTEQFDKADALIRAAMIDHQEPEGWGEGVFVLPLLRLADARTRIRRADHVGLVREREVLAELAKNLKEFQKDNGFRMDWLVPLALIATAGIHRLLGTPEAADFPLSEAGELINRSGNILHSAELKIEQCRFHLAIGRKTEAQKSILDAIAVSARMGYKCRSVEMERLLTQCSPG